jgi:hypothetical protein
MKLKKANCLNYATHIAPLTGKKIPVSQPIRPGYILTFLIYSWQEIRITCSNTGILPFLTSKRRRELWHRISKAFEKLEPNIR